MVGKSLNEQIERARELLGSALHAAMATVNEDGSPHNTPYLFMYDAGLQHLFWGSHPDSLHSQNILRTGQLFVVLYDADRRGGLYIRADGGRILDKQELADAMKIHNAIRAKRGLNPLPLSYYEDDSPQRMWIADVRQMWVNATKRDKEGRIIQDLRTEVTAEDLLAH